MLYDPKWEVKTGRTNFRNQPAFVAWLETKPAGKEYCYTDNGRCLIAQWLIHLGHKEVSVEALGRFTTGSIKNGVAPKWMWAAAIKTPHTFGHALQRVRDGFER